MQYSVCVCVSAIILTLSFLLSLVIPLILISRKAEQSSEKSDRESGNGDPFDILISSSRLGVYLRLAQASYICEPSDSSGTCETRVF